jgi:cytoskeletal protein CcmA (bactofilin family)
MFRRRIRDRSSGPTTYLAPETHFAGTLSGPGAFVICGIVEGESDIDGPVTLAQGGSWRGTLKATDVIVAGTVEGDVVATGRVEIASTAHVRGSLSGHSIAVAQGAVIEGDIHIASGEKPVQFTEKRKD